MPVDNYELKNWEIHLVRIRKIRYHPHGLYRKSVKIARMKGKIVKLLLLVFSGLTALLSGCAVESEFLAKFPLMEARSDKIPGLDSPHQRKKQIREKGAKGATAAEAEKEILVAQLMYEYQTSPDPNMRREAVDALAKIPYPQRDRYLEEILKDENPFVRVSALEAMGNTYSGNKEDLTALLIARMKADPDKDVRLSSIRILGQVYPRNTAGDSYRSVVLELGNLLHDKVPAVRYEAMQSLQKVTGMDYGNDINRWAQFIRYTNGEVPDSPSERTFSEKMPRIALPMFK